MKEDFLQYKICQWLEEQNIKYFHVPNGGKRSKSEAARMVSTGVKAGVPDLVLLLPYPDIIFIEIKTDKGTLSTQQKKWRHYITLLDYQYHLLAADSPESGIAQMRAILQDYDLPLEKIAPPSEL